MPMIVSPFIYWLLVVLVLSISGNLFTIAWLLVKGRPVVISNGMNANVSITSTPVEEPKV